MHVVIFEGSHWTRLAPLSLSRPVFMLRSGTGTLLDSQLRHLKPTRVTFWVRSEMVAYCERHVLPRMNVPADINQPIGDEPAMLTSGRTMHFSQFEYPNENAVVIDEGDIIRSAWVRDPGLNHDDVMNRTPRWLKLLELPRVMPQSRLVDYPWDLLSWNEESLVEDSLRSSLRPAVGQDWQDGLWRLVQPENVFLADNVKLQPGAVLDASGGPIILGERASIGANSVILGPAYIGDYTQVMPLTFIRGGTSIGPHCKIGGEVSNSIIEACVNKVHHGFIGDSYIGEWVNLGAGTTTSNLKNTYDEVTMQISGHTYETGRKFVGAIIGDHSKTAIGTRLMAGSYIGFCSSLAGSAIPPRYVPSFSWITDAGTQPFRMDKALKVMQAVYARRNREWTEADAAMVEVATRMAEVAEKPG